MKTDMKAALRDSAGAGCGNIYVPDAVEGVSSAEGALVKLNQVPRHLLHRRTQGRVVKVLQHRQCSVKIALPNVGGAQLGALFAVCSLVGGKAVCAASCLSVASVH